MMIVLSWVAAVVLAVLVIALAVWLLSNPDILFIVICVVTGLFVFVVLAMAAQQFIFLPWMQTWDIGW